MTESEFERELGFLNATSIGLGTMIGSGIFTLPSIAAMQASKYNFIYYHWSGFVAVGSVSRRDRHGSAR